jgi:hypothetical protein
MKLERGTMITDWCSSAWDNEQKNLQNVDTKLDEDKYVFNKLTKYGTLKGLYMIDDDDDGKEELYINADYIKAGKINATLIKAGALTVVNSANDEILKVDIDGSSVKIGGWTAGANYLYTAGNSFGGNNFIGLYTSNASGKVAG